MAGLVAAAAPAVVSTARTALVVFGSGTNSSNLAWRCTEASLGEVRLCQQAAAGSTSGRYKTLSLKRCATRKKHWCCKSIPVWHSTHADMLSVHGQPFLGMHSNMSDVVHRHGGTCNLQAYGQTAAASACGWWCEAHDIPTRQQVMP